MKTFVLLLLLAGATGLVVSPGAQHAIPLDFGEPIVMPTGTSPYFVVAADFNKDGFLDLATSNTISHDVTVFINKGDGTFYPGKSYPTKGLTPYALAAGDVNGDGLPDLVCGNMFSKTISIFLNKGDGTFAEAYTIEDEPGPMFTVLADVYNHKMLDIITCNIGHDDVAVFKNNGNGQFQRTGVHKSGGVIPYSIIAADFNKDGKVDLATGNIYSSNVSVLMNLGDGQFAPAVTYHTDSLTQILFAADFNGDGYPDIVSGNGGSDNVSVLINDRTGKFKPAANYPVKLPQGVAAADLNGDGFVDIATANQSANTTSILLNKGDGTFAHAIDFPVAALYPTSVALADLNNDGKLDLITANSGSNNISILLNGVHVPKVKSVKPSTSTMLRDGHLLTGIRALFNTAMDTKTLSRETVQVYGLQSGPHAPAVQGDESPESFQILPASNNGGTRFFAGEEVDVRFTTGVRSRAGLSMKTGNVSRFYVRPQTGSDEFSRSSGLPHVDGVTKLISADLDGDGRLDLVVARRMASSLLVYFNTATGWSDPVEVNTGGVDPVEVLAADVDGDGRVDLAVANALTNSVSVLFNAGGRKFEPAVSVAKCGQPAGLVVSDFNGDGRLDLAMVSKTSQQLTVLFNRGDREFQPGYSVVVNQMPSQLLATDFDRDGLDDLLVLSTQAGKVLMYSSQGDGNFLKREDLELGSPNVTSIAARDLDLDGAIDLVAMDAGSHKIGVLNNNGDGTFRPPRYFAVDGRPLQISIADIEAKGTPELLVLTQSGLHMYHSTNDGSYARARSLSGVVPVTFTTGEFGGRGSLDLVVFANHELAIFANQQTPVLTAHEGKRAR